MVEEEQSVDSTSMSPPEQLGASGQITMDGNSLARSNSKGSVTGVNLSGHAPFPPPKTDKPRPHVCTTCMRSFARLEHLKRHERSHTKEKPFECPECTRCFARRDLLLRHQQKLHSTTTPSSRPRSGRRESTAGVASGRVRKNSVANNAATTRPRANTLSHVDTGTLGVLTNNSPNQILGRNYAAGHNHHNSFSGMSGGLGYQYRGISTGHHASMSGLPRLETGLSVDLSGGLRTAPPFGGFGAEMGMNAFAFNPANASTINPHALHLHGMQGVGLEGSASPFQHFFGAVSGHQNMNDEDNNFDWMAHGFESQMSFAQAHENAIDDSSPSAMSTNSPTGVSELMLDGGPIVMQNLPSVLTPNWQQKMPNQIQMVNSPANMDFSSSTFNEMMHVPTGTMSPKSQLTQNGLGLDMNFSTPPDSSAIDPASMVPDFSGPPFHLPFNRPGGASTASTTSMDSSLRQSSITTVSSELVNDHTRNYLLAGLTQNAGFGQHKFSQPSVSSPLSPTSGTRSSGFNINNFPSLPDLQRYVSAYIQYFHPHLPFLHIVSLNFESLDYTTPLRSMPNHMQFGQAAIAGGGSCLVLSIAAIGALFEHDVSVSRDLFEYAKRFISSFLEERRKANLSKTQYGAAQHSELEDTPLWLVQAMLLNVIYGHNCGDKTAAENASNHCAALVSLARGAELTRPPVSPNFMYTNDISNGLVNASLHMNGMTSSGWNSMIVEPDDSDWRTWRVMEERKRTLYAVFILSSMLVTAYNHAPALTNSEIRLDLPCDEELWSADNAGAWRAMGGSAIAESKSVAFSAALGHLLTAAQREQHRRNSAPRSESGVADVIASQLKPSTFGCLVLINALHNYIWETRQRHLGRQWTTPETEQMHAHIEPALRAWQAAWVSNPCHSIERPNPFGAGPLSADSIPLLDLAYVRLFYNLGRAKEAFWQRDYDAMAEELGKNPDFVNVAETQQRMKKEMPPPNRRSSQSPQNLVGEPNLEAMDQGVKQQEPDDPPISAVPTTQRERYLRKAAQYAADHLSTADELGLSFADQTCRELPSQSAMCVFDCAQVLAEWVTTLQERVGKYIGIIGQDEMDLQQVPGVLLLEDVDRQLLEKIDLIAQSAWHKLGNEAAVPLSIEGGYASKILMLTAHMLERAAVWPVTKLMARSLETHARHMKGRVLASVSTAT